MLLLTVVSSAFHCLCISAQWAESVEGGGRERGEEEELTKMEAEVVNKQEMPLELIHLCSLLHS